MEEEMASSPLAGGRLVYIPSQDSITASNCELLNPARPKARLMSTKRKREEETETYSQMRESVFHSCIIKLRPIPGGRREPSLRRNVLLYNTLKHIRNEIHNAESTFAMESQTSIAPTAASQVFCPTHSDDLMMSRQDEPAKDIDKVYKLEQKTNVVEPDISFDEMKSQSDLVSSMDEGAGNEENECASSLAETASLPSLASDSFFSDSCSIFNNDFSTTDQLCEFSSASDFEMSELTTSLNTGSQLLNDPSTVSSIADMDSFCDFDFSFMDFDFPIQCTPSSTSSNSWTMFGSLGGAVGSTTCTHRNELLASDADHMVQILVGT